MADTKISELPVKSTLVAGDTIVLVDSATNTTKKTTVGQFLGGNMTNAEVKTAYEANANTNAYTDEDETTVSSLRARTDITGTGSLAIGNSHNNDSLYFESNKTITIDNTLTNGFEVFLLVGLNAVVTINIATGVLLEDGTNTGDTVVTESKTTLFITKRNGRLIIR